MAVDLERGRSRTVVVGLDGSGDSVLALIAGSRAAAVLHAGLVLASVRLGDRAPAPVAGDVETTLTAVQDRVLERAFPAGAQPRCTRALLQGDPARELMRAAQQAELLVLGGRGRGGFPGLPLGSVALLSVLHAPCPVLIVRGDEPLSPIDVSDAPGARTVVVGAERDTPRSAAVIRSAMRAAELLDAGLLVVSAWRRPDDLADDDRAAEGLARRAHEQQHAAIRAAFGADRPHRLRTVVREGSPAGVLVDTAADADLLVVGADDRDFMTGTLLGPVALTAVAHASCPVLVLHGAVRP